MENNHNDTDNTRLDSDKSPYYVQRSSFDFIAD